LSKSGMGISPLSAASAEASWRTGRLQCNRSGPRLRRRARSSNKVFIHLEGLEPIPGEPSSKKPVLGIARIATRPRPCSMSVLEAHQSYPSSTGFRTGALLSSCEASPGSLADTFDFDCTLASKEKYRIGPMGNSDWRDCLHCLSDPRRCRAALGSGSLPSLSRTRPPHSYRGRPSGGIRTASQSKRSAAPPGIQGKAKAQPSDRCEVAERLRGFELAEPRSNPWFKKPVAMTRAACSMRRSARYASLRRLARS
jgi:hypothetical protein